jgi:cupin 2 domain-containing protein
MDKKEKERQEGPLVKKNLFQIEKLPTAEELEESLCESGKVKIQRIISAGQASPPEFFYDQNGHEWVSLLQGEAQLRIEGERVDLRAGDSLTIFAHQKHRIEYTSTNPPCIWLCVFF